MEYSSKVNKFPTEPSTFVKTHATQLLSDFFLMHDVGKFAKSHLKVNSENEFLYFHVEFITAVSFTEHESTKISSRTLNYFGQG